MSYFNLIPFFGCTSFRFEIKFLHIKLVHCLFIYSLYLTFDNQIMVSTAVSSSKTLGI